ncbi:hypothetical protein FOA52_007437 [Chlamydomonas sp. UWO 241]|nr:hypothetical protein FOA52_007437 [Chlamydomonas sp. UWO 241]
MATAVQSALGGLPVYRPTDGSDNPTTTVTDEDGKTVRVERPDSITLGEINNMLKVKTNMIALGACERVTRMARFYVPEICENQGVVAALVALFAAGEPGGLTAGSLTAMAALAAHPEGRQAAAQAGAIPPAIAIVQRCDVKDFNTERAVTLLVNLSADQVNRRMVRDGGGVEALASLMKVAPLERVMGQAMAAMHNIISTDVRAKTRAADAGVAFGIARILGSRLLEAHTLSVRVRLLISDLLQVEDLAERVQAAASQMGLTLPSAAHANAGSRGASSGGFARAGSGGGQLGIGSVCLPKMSTSGSALAFSHTPGAKRAQYTDADDEEEDSESKDDE